MTKQKINEFKKKLLKTDGRTLTWFHREKLPKELDYSYFIFQINGFKKSGIDQNIQDAINSYMEVCNR